MIRYQAHAGRFDELAARRRRRGGDEGARIQPARPEGMSEPTARQLEVLQLVADGLSNREIAQRLWITEETAKSHLRAILTKLAAGSRAEAVAVGFRHGLLR